MDKRAYKHSFIDRHVGPDSTQIHTMLQTLGYNSLDDLIDNVVPKSIRSHKPLDIAPGLSEAQALQKLKTLASKNKIYKSYIGLGYHDCYTPTVIQRNILENPGWYTQYTPYQAEISQGRLEALLNFQTMVADLTGLPVANASLLDEATAAAEAMTLSYNARAADGCRTFLVDRNLHPQIHGVLQTRAEPLNIKIEMVDINQVTFTKDAFGILISYPGSNGQVLEFQSVISAAQANNSLVTLACDPLALVLLTSPGELGADIAIGSTQRFGVPLGFGGPHAAFFATKDEHKRRIPGRIIGVSKDNSGKPALRMALQTREQHIRREKATSNICTSQVLLAIMAGMYAVYHGARGLRAIANEVHFKTQALAKFIEKQGYTLLNKTYFDTITVKVGEKQLPNIAAKAEQKQINLRVIDSTTLAISLNETVEKQDFLDLLGIFVPQGEETNLSSWWSGDCSKMQDASAYSIPESLFRKSDVLTHPVFTQHQSETKLLRYIRSLEARDLSLTRSMIPLGSCTMKLNASSELYPITWSEFARLHPFCPKEQSQGYQELTKELEHLLAQCTGFDAVSLQPNSGAQGEYAGLLTIRKFHQISGQPQRDVCLIPKSAHGTNPASAVLAGMKVVVVDCDDSGNINVEDLRNKAAKYAGQLAALMVTYPSTHGVFEEEIRTICEIIHQHGGQVYMDGANMNAQIGLCYPGEFGPDVCHLNLHKTFCIPHGGGGPGVGPIAVRKHLAAFLPGHPLVAVGGEQANGPVSAAPFGSPCILPISLMYIWMMGGEGLTHATKIAILNANYIAHMLHPHFPVLYRGKNALVAHECIVDLRSLKSKTSIEVEDVAKRLMDYGFHAPTISFPVPGTMMIEPTESEALDELNRFCEAMIAIRSEIKAIETGAMSKDVNIVKNAPHTADLLVEEHWDLPYTREQAVFPVAWVRHNKFWPSVGRIDQAYGDRNLVCTCLPIAEYT